MLTEPTVLIKPQKVPNKPRKIKSPIRYLEISLFSSSLAPTPSKIDMRDKAEKLPFSLESESITLTVASKTGFFAFLLILLVCCIFESHLTSGTSFKVCLNIYIHSDLCLNILKSQSYYLLLAY